MYAYSGELEVQGGAFILDADRLVIREGVVAFMFSGSDGDGDFKAQGTAMITSRGTYVANQVKVDYQGFGKESDDHATIQFDVVMPTAKQLRCQVEGKWLQGETWQFSGKLRKFKEKAL